MDISYRFYSKALMLLFLSIGFGLLLFPQSGLEMSVSGFVKDINTNKPLPGVEIIIFKIEQDEVTGSFSETSDQNGFFRVRYLPAGSYCFRIKVPGYGILGSTLEGKDFDKLDIIEGKNVYLSVFLGDSEISSFEKSISLDGSMITVKILYDKDLYTELEALQKDERSGLNDNLREGGLIILPPKIILVEDNYVIKDSDDDICDSALGYKYPQVTYREINCVEENGKCHCFYNGLKCEIATEIQIHQKTYFQKFHPQANDSCLNCILECVLIHEYTHEFLMNKFIQNEWNSIRSELQKEIDNSCCESDSKCVKECSSRLIPLIVILIKKIKGYAPGTEPTAKAAYAECLKQKCNKIKTCEEVKPPK